MQIVYYGSRKSTFWCAILSQVGTISLGLLHLDTYIKLTWISLG